MNRTAMIKVGIAAAAFLLALSFVADLRMTARGGAQDLRNHITGARELEQGIDPYRYRWQAGDPVSFYDPVDATVPAVSRVTVTPTMLLLHLPLAHLSYFSIRFVWLVIQWLLLLGTGFIWWRCLSTPTQRGWWLATVVAFTYTSVWRLHAERGQAYVLLLFLFSLWLAATLSKEKRAPLLAGLAAALLIALRPPCLFLVPFMALHKRGQLPALLVGLLVFFVMPMIPDHACWSQYFSAMRVHSWSYLHDNMPPVEARLTVPDVEGVPASVMAHPSSIVFTTFSAYRLLRHFGSPVLPASMLLLSALIPYGLWLFFARRQPLITLAIAMAAWFFLFDFFLPADRISYNDVLILALMATLLMGVTRPTPISWLCLAAIVMSWGVLLWPHAIVRELPNLPVLCWALASCLALFSRISKPRTFIDGRES